MKKLIITLSFIFISGICSSQIKIDSINVFWANGVDSIYLKYTSYIPKVNSISHATFNNVCSTTIMSFSFVGCSTSVAVQKDTLLIIPIPNISHLLFYTVWDTSSSCNFPTSSVSTDSYVYNVCFPTSIEKTENLANKINIYPNPVKEAFSINLLEEIQIHQVELIDLQGRLVKSYQNSRTALDVSSVSSGIYFVKITTAKGIAMKKIVVN